MGNKPELYFVIVVAIVLASIALTILISVTAGFLVFIKEWRSWKRADRVRLARMEMRAREQGLEIKKLKEADNQKYWNEMLRQIDKESRVN